MSAIDRLRASVTAVEQILADEGVGDVALGRLVDEQSAKQRFVNGTYELRLSGVVGSSTSGSPGEIIDSWLRAARRKVAKSEGAS